MPISILRLPDVTARVGLKRTRIYQLMDLGQFPKSIRLGEQAIGWRSDEIDRWIDERTNLTRSGRLRPKSPIGRPRRVAATSSPAE